MFDDSIYRSRVFRQLSFGLNSRKPTLYFHLKFLCGHSLVGLETNSSVRSPLILSSAASHAGENLKRCETQEAAEKSYNCLFSAVATVVLSHGLKDIGQVQSVMLLTHPSETMHKHIDTKIQKILDIGRCKSLPSSKRKGMFYFDETPDLLNE